MALAPFFDKTAMAAATVLRGFDRDEFERILEAQVIGIAFDDTAACATNGRTTLELVANLIARLYPRIALIPLGQKATTYATDLRGLTSSINPAIEILEDASAATACLAVGENSPGTACSTIYVGSEGWIVRVSARAPVGCGYGRNPFGAAAAACFGAANVFRIVFSEQLENGELDEEIRMSLLDLDPSSKEPPNPMLMATKLAGTYLVGAGAIGNGALWVLARVPELSGVLHVVDGEAVDAGNPQRYVLTTPADRDVGKVEIAAREFRTAGSAIDVRPHRMTWGHYLAGLPTPWELGVVAVALDSAEDRIAVQAALGRRTLNAWTQAGDLGISRHDFLGDRACLACMYLPDSATKHEDQVIAEALGLSDRLMNIRVLLYTGAAVGEQLIQEIAQARDVPVEPLLPYADRPMREFYSEVICGGVLFRLQGGAEPRGGTEVPMAFQSALAGILLAAGIVGEAAGLPAPAHTKAAVDLLRPLGQHLTVPVAKHLSGRCICQDSDFQAVFKTRHGGAGNADQCRTLASHTVESTGFNTTP